jgi:hypothetical protein
MAARYKAWVCGRSLAGIVGSNPAGGGGHGYLSPVSVVICQGRSWSLPQRYPTEYGVSECDSEAPIMRRPWPTKCCCAMETKNLSCLCKSRLDATLYLVCRWLVLRIYLCLKWTPGMEKSTRVAFGNPVYSILAYGPYSYHCFLLILTHPLQCM